MSKQDTKTTPFSMRLRPDLKRTLKEMADRENRSLTNFVETQLVRVAEQYEREKAAMQ